MRADAQPIDFLLGLHLTQPDVRPVETFRRAEFGRDGGVLVGGKRPDGGDPARARATLGQHIERRSDGRLAAPGDIGLVREQGRLRLMVDPLYEQRVALTRREDADRLGGHRPARQILHDGADAVGAAENKMIALRPGHQRFHRAAVARHLGV
ncbi:MAG TPA: hypothetical protein VGC38_01575 [Pseudolabrys sp.]